MAMTEEERKAKKREIDKKYGQSEKGKERIKKAKEKYAQSEKGRKRTAIKDKKRNDLAKNTNDMFLKSYLRYVSYEKRYKQQSESLKTATKKGKWTQEEIDFLLTSSLKLFDKAIYLKRSHSSVIQKHASIKKAKS